MTSKGNSMKAPVSGPKVNKGLKAMLLGLLMVCVAMVSACQSSSQIKPSPPSKHTIEASLMVEPNYTQRLLKLLSESPSMQTIK